MNWSIDNVHVIFDLDWTLSDSQKFHQEIEKNFLITKGIEISAREIEQNYAWRSPIQWIPELLDSKSIPYTMWEIEEFIKKKDEILLDWLRSWNIPFIPWAKEAIIDLFNSWYKLWISSWACREFIDAFVKNKKLDKYITYSTSADEVENKKPHPDVFNETFKKLKNKFWTPHFKFVLWDGLSDAEWWSRSGAKTIRIPSQGTDYTLHADRITKYVDLKIDSLFLSEESIQSLIAKNS